MATESDVWVVNASPLISLERIGCLTLLERLAKEVVLPSAVITEIGTGPRALLSAQLGSHRVVTIPAIHPVVAAWDLGAGESEVVSWAASAPGAVAVVDDRAARNCAAALGVRTIGTLRVLLDAKSAGLVPAIRPLVEGLRAGGLFLSDELIEKVLNLADEP
jgi:predicted nucleic acid-binding protein